MKKITLLLISLVLACTCVFAGFSFTVGGGFGSRIPFYEFHESVTGPAVFTGVDFTMKNGFTLYDDFEVNYFSIGKDVLNAYSEADLYTEYFYNLSEKIGAGYTFSREDWKFMFGCGLEMQILIEDTDLDAEGKREEAKKDFRIGMDTRFKATYCCTERLGLTVQINPSLIFKSLGPDKDIFVKDAAELTNNVLVGFSFMY